MRAYSIEREREYYERAWPTSLAPIPDLASRLAWVPIAEFLRGQIVVDLGAGECVYTRALSDFGKARQIIALDLFPERMLPCARSTLWRRIAFVGADARLLPLKSSSVDLVFCSLALSQLGDTCEVMAEVARVLRPCGWYLGIEPNPLNVSHLGRYLLGKHSPNQFLLTGATFERACRANLLSPGIRHFSSFLTTCPRILSSCIGLIAQKAGAPMQDSSVSPRLRPLELRDARMLAVLHLRAHPKSIMAQLGIRYLERYYERTLTDVGNSFGWCACDADDTPIAFCLGVRDSIRLERWRRESLPAFNPSAFNPGRGMWTAMRRHIVGSILSQIRHARSDPRDVGCLSGTQLVQIICSPPMRGRGIGRTLIQKWEQTATALGLSKAFLFVAQDNRPAVGLYRSTGWKIVRGSDKTREVAWVMEKTLERVPPNNI